MRNLAKSHEWLFRTLILLLGGLIYWPAVHGSFVFDDVSTIVDNPHIKDLNNFTPVSMLTGSRSIGLLSFALNYRLAALNPFGYHLVNIAIHLGCALILYELAKTLIKLASPADLPDNNRVAVISLITALLFTLHPIQTQAVSYIAQRFASLSALGYLATMLLYLRTRQMQSDSAPPARWLAVYMTAIAATILAMRCKETAFTIPLCLLLCEVMFPAGRWRTRIIRLAPFFLLLCLIPVAMLHTLPAQTDLASSLANITRADEVVPRTTYLITQFRVIATYLRLLLIPINQNVDYDYPLFTSLLTTQVAAALLLELALLATALRLYWQSRLQPRTWTRLAAFGICFFFLTLSVESSLIPIADVIFEHRLYLPTCGIFLVVSAVAVPLLRAASTKSRCCFFTATTLILALLAAATWQRNRLWSDPVLILSDTATKSPGKVRLRSTLGALYLQQGKYIEAHRELTAAMALDPASAEALVNMGNLYLATGATDLAIKQYTEAIRVRPDTGEAWLNLGAAYESKRDLAQAQHAFEMSVKNAPALAEAHLGLARIRLAKGDTVAARAELLETLRLRPDLVEAVELLRQTETAR